MTTKKPLTKAEYEALASAVALADTDWEDTDPRRRATLDRAWRKLQAWQNGSVEDEVSDVLAMAADFFAIPDDAPLAHAMYDYVRARRTGKPWGPTRSVEGPWIGASR